jgi:hypothetical protein
MSRVFHAYKLRYLSRTKINSKTRMAQVRSSSDIENVESRHPYSWEQTPRIDYQEKSLTNQHNI